jgi:hypothetical protein
MKRIACLLGIITLASGLPAMAQYHQSYGDSRVVNQNQTGLYTPSGTYIGAGTMSRSAQGKQAGSNAGGLPTTSWGGYIRNPGDDIYTGNNGAMRMDNGSMVYGDEIARANAIKRMRQQERMMQYQQRRNMYGRQAQPQGNLYVPGSNGGAANYGSGVAGYGSYGGR